MTQAFLYAPLVYVDYNPQDPSKEYQARGMTLITITIPDTHKNGPIAVRKGDLVIPGTEVAFGGFATLLGFPSTADPTRDNTTRDIYLIGADKNGLQLARVALDDSLAFAKYTYFEPQSRSFSTTAPSPDVSDSQQMYLPGTFTSGSVSYSETLQTPLSLSSRLTWQRSVLQHLCHDIFQPNGRFYFLHSISRPESTAG